MTASEISKILADAVTEHWARRQNSYDWSDEEKRALAEKLRGVEMNDPDLEEAGIIELVVRERYSTDENDYAAFPLDADESRIIENVYRLFDDYEDSLGNEGPEAADRGMIANMSVIGDIVDFPGGLICNARSYTGYRFLVEKVGLDLDEMRENDPLERLGELMVKHGAVVRAVPETETSVFAPRHKDDPRFDAPDVLSKEIFERNGQEWLRVVRKPRHAGKFFIETGQGTGSTVMFEGKNCYASLSEVVKALEEMDRPKARKKPALKM